MRQCARAAIAQASAPSLLRTAALSLAFVPSARVVRSVTATAIFIGRTGILLLEIFYLVLTGSYTMDEPFEFGVVLLAEDVQCCRQRTIQ